MVIGGGRGNHAAGTSGASMRALRCMQSIHEALVVCAAFNESPRHSSLMPALGEREHAHK